MMGVRAAAQCSVQEHATAAEALAARYQSFRARCLLHAFAYRGKFYVVDPVSGLMFTTNARVHAAATSLSSPTLLGRELATALEAADLATAAPAEAGHSRLRRLVFAASWRGTRTPTGSKCEPR
jgi:hypothetical protein